MIRMSLWAWRNNLTDYPKDKHEGNKEMSGPL